MSSVKTQAAKVPLDRRRAGVLAHITSLPGPLGNGDFSHDAYRFVKFAAEAGFTVWQVLPLQPTHEDGSPYYCTSAMAGNPMMISLDWLIDRGWLTGYDQGLSRNEAKLHRIERLRDAHRAFVDNASPEWKTRYQRFCEQSAGWLEDYVRFVALDAEYRVGWTDWPEALRERRGAAYDRAIAQLEPRCSLERFQQFVFATQWAELRSYAHTHGIYLFGDLPFFVAHHSADVWAQPELWQLDSAGHPSSVAGVPPDYFSETGQLWGNPLYRWEQHRKQKFDWWIGRFERRHELFDLLRVDHFRGLDACWEIPAGEKTAVNGAWM